VRSPSIAVGRIAAAGRFADRGGGVSTKASARISIEKLDRLERAGARARIEHSAERTEIRLENLELVVAGGLTWRGRARSIEIRGAQTQVRGLALSSAAGRLEADADLGPGGERVELAIRGLDLAQARALHQLPLRGQLEADLSAARRRGRFEGELTASVRKLSAPGLPPVDTQLEASLAGRRLAAKGSLDPVTGGGAARFDIALDVPTDPTDPAAWLRLGLADVSRLAVDLEQVDARQIERFAGIAIEGDGVASASLRVPDDGAHRLGIRAKVSGGRAGLVRHLGATIEGHWDGAGLRGDASLEHAGELVASATLSLATGIETLWRDPAALSRASADAQVTLNGFRLARLVAAKLIATPIAGFLTATIRASGTLEKPRLRVEQGVVTRLEIDKMRLRSLELSGTYEGGRGEANVVATPRTGGAIRAAIEGDVERRALRATLSGRAIQLEGLRPLAPDADHPLASLAGKLDLIRVVIDVSPERLAASGQIAVREGSIVVEDGARKIEGIGAEIALRGDRVRLLGVRAKSGGGSLAASGSVRFAGYQPTELELDVIADDVPYVAGSWAASIDLASRITGRFRAGRWIVEAPVHRGEVTLRDTGRELQDIAALEDVVFVDRKSRRARAAGDSPLRARLNINLGKGIEIRSKDIDAILVGSLTADVDGAAPVRLSGELRTRRGTFRFFDLDYNIVRAVATFDGRVPTDPDLDIEITRRFRQATVAVQVHGKLSRVLGDSRGEHVTLSSDSGYTQEQVLALMLGQDPDDDSQSGGGDIGGVGRAVVAGEVRGALRSVGIRIDVVKFHQDGWEVGKWFRLKLGSFIDRRILIGARVRDTEEPRKNASEGTVEIPLTDSLNLEGRVGDRTIGNIDLLWIKRF
jgi:autotransporter translocation and assembly factor TamB